MNYYPGEGLGIGTAILGNTVGQPYPAGTLFTLCKIHGLLLTPDGLPVGAASSDLIQGATGLSLKSTWRGETVTAGLTLAGAQGLSVITTDRLTTVTNEHGYFEFHVIQGLTITVSCPSFGKTVSVPTLGLTDIDISTYF